MSVTILTALVADVYTFELFEHFLRQPDANTDVLEDVAEEFGMEFTPAEKQEIEDGIDGFERSPQVAVTDISVVTDDEDSK